jgi:predicted ABC-type ATPase
MSSILPCLTGCDLLSQVSERLNGTNMNKLRSFIRENNINCDEMDKRKKQTLCLNITTYLVSSICDTILDVSSDQLSVSDRYVLDTILRTIDIEFTSLSEKDKCIAIQKRLDKMGNAYKKLTDLQKTHPHATNVLGVIKNAIVSMLFVYVSMSTTEVCDTNKTCVATLSVPEIKNKVDTDLKYPWETTPCDDPLTCNVELLTSSSGHGRHFVTGDIEPNLSMLIDDKDVYDNVKAAVLDTRNTLPRNKHAVPVITYIVGGAGAGKGYSMKSTIMKNKTFVDGMRGAVTLNSDDIMSSLPGYDDMIDLDVKSWKHPASFKNAAHIYHDPAKAFSKRLLKEFMEQGESIILDTTGTNVEKMKRIITDAKSLGYLINMIAVVTDDTVRENRVYDRNIKRGRFVASDIVTKSGKSVQEWKRVLQPLYDSSQLNALKIINNN